MPLIAAPTRYRAVCHALCLAAVVLAAPAGAQVSAPPGPETPSDDLGARIVGGLRPIVRVTNGWDTAYALADRMRYYHVPGVSIAVIDGGRVVWAQGYGTTEAGGTQRVDTATVFQAGSISKPVFATAALAPLDMSHSTYEQPLPAAMARNAASGHERPDSVVPGRYHTYPEMAAAGLWTTPSDLARWAIGLSRAYRGDPNAVLTASVARQMLTPQVELPGGPPWRPRSSWGLGVELAGTGDSLRFMHGGRNEGFLASLVMYPALGRGLVVMTNGVGGPLLAEITRAFDAEFGLATEPRVERRLAAAAPDTALTGRYRLVFRGDTVTFTVRRGGDVLLLDDGRSERRLLPGGTDAFFAVDGVATFGFERDARGRGRSLVLRPVAGQPVVAERIE